MCSERPATRLAVILGLLLGLLASPCLSVDLPSPDSALSLAFPGAQIERSTVFLTQSQLLGVASLSGIEGQSPLVTRYTVTEGGKAVAWAYLDTHRVRTLRETVLITVGSTGEILRIEVIAFAEPPEYLPPETWYRQFDDLHLGEELGLKSGIRPITGATLSARAAVSATRRVLAVHKVLQEHRP